MNRGCAGLLAVFIVPAQMCLNDATYLVSPSANYESFFAESAAVF